jgi:tetratricopeptide (TPR) repeat protein
LIKTNFAAVIDAYKKAIDNTYYDAYYELGEIQYWQGNMHEAKTYYTNGLGFVIGNKLINTYHALADMAIIEKDDKAATKYLVEASKLGDMSAIYHIGLLYKDKLPQGIAFFRPTTNSDNLYAIILGRIYMENNDHKNAVLCFNIGLRNGYKYALFEVGKLYEKRADIAKATDYYQQAVKFDIAYAYNRLGALAQNDNKYKTAYVNYSKSAQLENPEGVMHVASLYAVINKLEKAIQFYNHAIEIVDHKELKKVYFNLGIIYSKIKVVDKAINMLLKAY